MYFVDAMHIVWAGVMFSFWCFSRIWHRSPTGRQRFNVLGALNAVTNQVITVSNDSYINSWSVVELLWKLRSRFLETRIPITLILDNAKYQRCYLVQGLAHLMGIELIFLPPYSPNLNLIERLWKFVKKKCLPLEHEDFDDFQKAVLDCINSAYLHYAEEMESLLTWNFQTIPETTEKAA